MSSTLASAAVPMHQDVYDSSNIGTLGRLPPEIRRQIYGLYFGCRIMTVLNRNGREQPGRLYKSYLADLLLVSKALFAEAKPIEAFAPVTLELQSILTPVDCLPRGLSERLLDLTTSITTTHGLKVDALARLDFQLYPKLQELHLNPVSRKSTPSFQQYGSTIDDLVKGRLDHALVEYVQQQVPINDESYLRTSLSPERFPPGVQIVVDIGIAATTTYYRSDRWFKLVGIPFSVRTP